MYQKSLRMLVFLGCFFGAAGGLLYPQSSVPLGVFDGSLSNVNWNACVQRATQAMQSAGFQNVRATGAGPGSASRTYFVGGQHPTYTAYILCRPAGSTGSTYTVAVAGAPGSNAFAMRDTLVRAMQGQTAAGPEKFAGRWRLEYYNRTITMQVDGNRVLMYDPEVGGTGSGTVTRTSAGTLKLTGRGRSQFGTNRFTMELSADGNSFTGSWAIDGGTSGAWRGRRIN